MCSEERSIAPIIASTCTSEANLPQIQSVTSELRPTAFVCVRLSSPRLPERNQGTQVCARSSKLMTLMRNSLYGFASSGFALNAKHVLVNSDPAIE